jgi:hypothetical protein
MARPPAPALLALAALAGAALLVGGAPDAAPTSPEAASPWAPEAGIRLPRALPELSGLVRSPSHAGLWWAHNDSGNVPALLGLGDDGSLRATVRLDVPFTDPEALAVAPDGALWLGDIGDNDNVRDDLTVYRFEEPAPADVRAPGLAPTRALRVRWADRPPRAGAVARDYDLEAMFFADGALWLLSKQRATPATRLLRVALDAGDDVVLEPAGAWPLDERGPYPHMVTDAAWRGPVGASPSRLALLTYEAVYLFSGGPMPGSDTPLGQPGGRMPLVQPRMGQTEAIALDGDRIVVGAEGSRWWWTPLPPLSATP